jgi:hypothetical protein
MLTKNEKFLKEFQDFSSQIEKISQENVKNDLKQLLQKLLREAKHIDRQHEELLRGGKLSSESLTDHRSEIMSVRRQIVKKIQDCKSAGLIKS